MFSISFVDAAGNVIDAGSEIRLVDATDLEMRLISAAVDFADAAEVVVEVVDASGGVATSTTVDYAPVLTLETLDLAALAGDYALRISVLDSSGAAFGLPQESGLAFGAAPAPYAGVRLEAEDATLADEGAGTVPVVVEKDTATGSNITHADNASGDAYVDIGFATGGESVEFAVNVPEDGFYDLSFGYALGGLGANRSMRLDVNETLHDRILDLRSTSDTGGDFSVYGTAKTRVFLTEGQNAIRLTSNGFSGPNIDYLDVAPADPTVFVFQAEDLATGNNKAIDSGSLVDGSDTYRVGAEGGAYLDWAGTGEVASFEFDAPAAGTYAIRVTYAASSDRPLNLELVNGTASNLATFAFVKTDGISAYPDDLADLDPLLLPKINSNALSAGWEGWTTEEQIVTLTEGGATTLRLINNLSRLATVAPTSTRSRSHWWRSKLWHRQQCYSMAMP